MSKNSKSQIKPNGTPEEQGLWQRRAFVGVVLGGAGLCYAGAIGYPVYRYLASANEKFAEIAKISEVKLEKAKLPGPGTVLMFKFGSFPAMLIHHKDGSMVALSAKCTHLGCTVQYESDKNRIFCGCHGGIYDPVSGQNKEGPPPKPLTKYVVKTTDAGDVVISRT